MVRYHFQTEQGDVVFGVRAVDDGGGFVKEIVPEASILYLYFKFNLMLSAVQAPATLPRMGSWLVCSCRLNCCSLSACL